MTDQEPDPMSPARTHATSGALLCNARNRAGEECGQVAIRGLTKCRHHAGISTAEARIKGLQALGTIVPTSIDRLAGIIDDQDATNADLIRAIKVVFDTALDSRSVGELERISEEQELVVVNAFIRALADVGINGETAQQIAAAFQHHLAGEG
jgi:uncharacterized protein YjiS (DUF1127 family)